MSDSSRVIFSGEAFENLYHKAQVLIILFFLIKQYITPVFPLFCGIHTLGKQAGSMNHISMPLCMAAHKDAMLQ